MKQRQSKNAFVGALTFLWLMALFVTVYAQQPAQDPLLAWLDRIAQLQLQRRERAIAEIRTVADAEKRKQWARAKILELIGGLPDYDGPLNARVTGRVNGDSIVIEKVIFESRQPRSRDVTAEYGDEQTGKIEIHVLHLSLVLTTEREGGVPGMTKDLKYISLRQCPRSSTPSYCVMEIGDQGGFPCEK